MLLYLEPLDTLFFRDSRPFDAGMDAFAESTLPSPLAIYGALGSHILNIKDKSFEDFRENGDDLLGPYSEELNEGKLRIRGIFISLGEQLFLPVPANLFGYGTSRVLVAKPNMEDLRGLRSDIPQGIHPLSITYFADAECKQLNGFIAVDVVKKFLNDELDTTERIWSREEFLLPETRYGTSIDESSLTVREGYLYGATHLRFKKEPEQRGLKQAGVAVLIDDLPVQIEGLCSLGGERRKACIRLGDSNKANMKDYNALGKIISQKRFFLYLITPAVLTNGWELNLPKKQFKGAIPAGAAVNKPEYVSGWIRQSSASGCPRRMRRMVPAGSVYFYEAPSWEEADFKKAYEWAFENSFSDEYRAAGFGAAAMGVW